MDWKTRICDFLTPYKTVGVTVDDVQHEFKLKYHRPVGQSTSTGDKQNKVLSQKEINTILEQLDNEGRVRRDNSEPPHWFPVTYEPLIVHSQDKKTNMDSQDYAGGLNDPEPPRVRDRARTIALPPRSQSLCTSIPGAAFPSVAAPVKHDSNDQKTPSLKRQVILVLDVRDGQGDHKMVLDSGLQTASLYSNNSNIPNFTVYMLTEQTVLDSLKPDPCKLTKGLTVWGYTKAKTATTTLKAATTLTWNLSSCIRTSRQKSTVVVVVMYTPDVMFMEDILRPLVDHDASCLPVRNETRQELIHAADEAALQVTLRHLFGITLT